MSDLGFEPDKVRSWLATPIGGKVASDNPAIDRMADVVLEAMIAAGGDDADLQLLVLTKVQAMVVAGMIHRDKTADVNAILLCVGPDVQDEAIRFLRAMRQDIRGSRSHA